MQFTRSKHVLGSPLVMLTMLVASVSACACNHHATKAVKAKPSCHAAVTHEPLVAAETPTDNDRIEKDCNCTIRVSPASVLARSESDRAPQQKPAAVNVIVAVPQPTAAGKAADELLAAIQPDLYETLDHPHAPSRAPPRL